jgi:glycosyltransferase involved in cell wall biosynthesis
MIRLLTIGHSYVVAANRRLAHEMALQGGTRWEVTAIAPRRFRGDLRRLRLEPIEGEADHLEPLDVGFDRSPHLMWYRDLERVLSQKWDVVHCWEEPYVLAGAQIARAVPRNARFAVATFQNLSKQYPWPLSAFERRTMTRADGWIAFGHTVHDTLVTRELYAHTPSRVIPPGVDTERFKRDEPLRRRTLMRLGWSSSDPIVGFLGRFVAPKGIDLLITALRSTAAPWRALFVGGGPMEPDLRRFAAEYPGRVHVETSATHDDVPAWLNAMSVLCAPSQTTRRWREQFGRMLIEAMVCGVPVIASNSGEMPAVVGDAGVIVDENDARAWAAEIDRALADPAWRQERAERGLERARTRFAWPTVAREHLEFFDTLLDGRRS